MDIVQVLHKCLRKNRKLCRVDSFEVHHRRLSRSSSSSCSVSSTSAAFQRALEEELALASSNGLVGRGHPKAVAPPPSHNILRTCVEQS